MPESAAIDQPSPPRPCPYNNLGIIEIQRAFEMELLFDFDGAEMHWRRAMDLFHEALELDPASPEANANVSRFRDAY